MPTPGEDPQPVPTPTPGQGRPNVRTGRPASAGGTSAWRYWWEFNRANLVGARHLLERHATVTGAAKKPDLDTLKEHRGAVLAALRAVAGDRTAERSLRGPALVALGRSGEGRDAALFLRVLGDAREPTAVHEAAAVAVGLLAESGDAETRASLRARVNDVLAGSSKLGARTRGLLIISAGLRAREDKALMTLLATRIAAGPKAPEDAAVLAFACGLAGDYRTVPELMRATTERKLGRARLDDTVRSHATLALGNVGDAAATPALVTVLKSRRTGRHTKRSAALALGRMLREGQVAEGDLADVRKELTKILRRKGDVVLRGFCALALAGAEEPQGIAECKKLLDGARAELRPFAALALGLAARNTDAETIRRELAKELERSRDIELASALCIALGLAGAKEAVPALLERVQKKSLPAELRGAAAIGAGLLSRGSARTEEVLLAALEDAPPALVGEAALGLGFVGRRSVGPVLLKMVAEAGSSFTRGRVVMALGSLGHSGTVEPLLRILRDKTAKTTLRAQAAIALGLLGDTRETDPLFALATDFNFFATTPATHELLDQM